MESLPSRAALEAAHTFPGPYTFKVFGPNSDGFTESVRAAAVAAASTVAVETTYRASANGRHVCVTLVITMDSADRVLDMYRALRAVKAVSLLL